MGQRLLRRFETPKIERLAALLIKAKGNRASNAEEAELLNLLIEARRISDGNVRKLEALRSAKPRQAKIS